MSGLNVSHIQRFSTGDGPGIRTTVFLKGCTLRCPWCHNPETLTPEPLTLRYPSGKCVACGVRMTPAQIAADAAEDAEFYAASGGGVTFSGGEPLLQAEGAAETAELLSRRGIPSLIDTAGCVPWGAFETVLPAVCDFFFDLKAGTAEQYARLGGDLSLVLDNLRRLVARGANVRVRIPFIPGFNSSDEDCRRIGELLAAAGAKRADLLPFHRLASAKYEALGRDYAYRDVPPPTPEEIARAAAILRQYADLSIE